MANLLTHATTFKKENVREFFVDPFFRGRDIRDRITVRTDVKGTEVLNRVSRPSKITRRKTAPGFTPVGAMNLTTTEITVKPLAIEFEQNGRAFIDSVVQAALAKGFLEDDVQNMTDPDFWAEIVLPILAESGKEDLIRQMWFADEKHETNDTAVVSTGVITGVADVDYQVYTGFWTRFIENIEDGVIPSEQRIVINNGAVKQEVIETLSGITAGSITLTVNNVAFVEPFDTDATTTVTNWFNTHAAAIKDRGATTGVIVTNPSAAAVKFVAEHPGQAFIVTETDAGTGGSWAATGIVANVIHGALGTDEADNTMNAVLNGVPEELLEFSNQMFHVTRSINRNYIGTLKALGTEAAHQIVLNGITFTSYEGFPVIVYPEFDKWIRLDQNGVYPHRVLFTVAENLFWATDGADDDEAVETWYDRNLQLRRYRVQYKAQTIHLHNELIMLAY